MCTIPEKKNGESGVAEFLQRIDVCTTPLKPVSGHVTVIRGTLEDIHPCQKDNEPAIVEAVVKSILTAVK